MFEYNSVSDSTTVQYKHFSFFLKNRSTVYYKCHCEDYELKAILTDSESIDII